MDDLRDFADYVDERLRMCDILEALARCIAAAAPFAEHERTRQALNRLIDATSEIISKPPTIIVHTKQEP